MEDMEREIAAGRRCAACWWPLDSDGDPVGCGIEYGCVTDDCHCKGCPDG